MAGADALRAPERTMFAGRRAQADKAIAGNARIIAAPAYRRLLAAEPLLKRSIPTLILVFLLVIAGARFLSLMELREDVERDAKSLLLLADGELSTAFMVSDV